MHYRKSSLGILTAAALFSVAAIANAGSYTVSYTDGGTWNTVYAQGFNTQLGASPDPGANVGDTVTLSQFQFYKSGTADSASNIQLAIFNTLYPNTTTMSTSSSQFVGLSTNTIASTASIATGAPIVFMFNNLPLIYGTDYGAIFVNNSGGTLTPVLVSALTANYVEESDNTFHPQTNYGTESQFNYATSDFINNDFFSAFSDAGDADFSASLAAVPEPAALGIIGLMCVLGRKRRG